MIGEGTETNPPIKTRGKGHSPSGKNNGIKLGRCLGPAVDELSGKDPSYKPESEREERAKDPHRSP